jgi:hypothetical protein
MSGPRDLALTADQRRLKRASKELVKAVGGQHEAADITGARQQRMSDVGLPNTPDFLRIDEVLALEEEALGSIDWPQVTRAMARHHRCILVRVPERPAAADWHREIGQLSKQAAGVIQTICEALCDGKVDAKEVAQGNIRERITEGQ